MKYFRALGAFLCLATLGSAAFDPVAFNAAVELYTQRKPLEAQQRKAPRARKYFMRLGNWDAAKVPSIGPERHERMLHRS